MVNPLWQYTWTKDVGGVHREVSNNLLGEKSRDVTIAIEYEPWYGDETGTIFRYDWSKPASKEITALKHFETLKEARRWLKEFVDTKNAAHLAKKKRARSRRKKLRRSAR